VKRRSSSDCYLVLAELFVAEKHRHIDLQYTKTTAHKFHDNASTRRRGVRSLLVTWKAFQCLHRHTTSNAIQRSLLQSLAHASSACSTIVYAACMSMQLTSSSSVSHGIVIVVLVGACTSKLLQMTPHLLALESLTMITPASSYSLVRASGVTCYCTVVTVITIERKVYSVSKLFTHMCEYPSSRPSQHYTLLLHARVCGNCY
jgi:hypothetical protein